jgi:hypothetical protein
MKLFKYYKFHLGIWIVKHEAVGTVKDIIFLEKINKQREEYHDTKLSSLVNDL